MNDQQNRNTHDPSHYELCDLLDRYVRDELSATETKHLQSLILNDPVSLAFYVQYMRDSFNLNRLADLYEKTGHGNSNFTEELSNHLLDDTTISSTISNNAENLSSEEQEQQKTSDTTGLGAVASSIKNFGGYMAQPIPLSMIIASVTLALGIMILTQIYFNNQPVGTPTPTDDLLMVEKAKNIQVAKVVATHNCIWDNETKPKKIGEFLYFGETLGILKGSVEIRFNRNAVIRLHNTSRIHLEGDNAVRLQFGKLAAYVPQDAKGFTVDTQVSRSVDLGTEFGVQTSADGSSRIQVRKGKVEVCPKLNGKVIDEEKQTLTEGDTVHISLAGTSVASVINENELKWINLQPAKNYHRWLVHSKKLQTDPDLIAYYTFERTTGFSGVLHNKAKSTASKLDGVLGISDSLNSGDRPRWTSGRWSSKGALQFDANKKQIVVVKNFSQIQPRKEMSICAWVKVERDEGYNTIVSLWNDSVSPAGRFFYLALRNIANEFSGNNLVIRTRISSDGINKDLEPVMGLKLADRVQRSSGWVHVVLTAKSGGGPVRLYRNGKLVAEADYPNKDFTLCKSKLAIGAMMHNKEHFTGLIDELAILKRAITSNEIKEMYKAGNPHTTVLSKKQ